MARADDLDFERFLDRDLGGLTRLAMVLTLDPHEAEDLAQQTAMKLQLKWHLVRRADNPPAYARRLLLNEFLANQRRKQRETRARTSAAYPPTATDDIAAHVERRLVITDLLGRLPGKQRAAIALRYLEDRPDGEIAVILNCREATVRSLVKRGLDTVRSTARDRSVKEIATP
jgi:RNA polymerase sigma factor (sigma-70 family)